MFSEWYAHNCGPAESRPTTFRAKERDVNNADNVVPGTWYYVPWTTLADLPKGALFETGEGVRAVKTEYHTFNGGTQCDCYLLESGEAAHFPGQDRERVREIVLR